MKLDNLVYATIIGTGTLLGGQAITPGKVSASQQQVEKQEKQSLEEQVREYTTTNEDKPEYWYDKARNLREKARSHKGTDTETYENLTDKAKNIFLKGVNMDMKKDEAEDILQPYLERGLIEKVDYNPINEETNFDELVYEDNDPRLVLFYSDKERDPENHNYVKRASIVFKRLTEKYNDEIEFTVHKIPSTQGYDNMTMREKNMFDKAEEENILSPPSIAMYGDDITTHETSFGQIDIIKDGPANAETIHKWTEDLPKWWINPNLFNESTPNGDLYRFKNTPDYHKIVEDYNFIE